MMSGASKSTETLSWTSRGLTAFILPQFVNYNTVTCDIQKREEYTVTDQMETMCVEKSKWW